jgi:antirestriction protein ArdC
MRNLHKEISDRILAQLKNGVAPWRRPWVKRAAVGELNATFPRNATTGKMYSGVNVLLLWGKAQDCGYSNPRWLTFKQAKEHGGTVRKGEKGTEIVFVSYLERADRSNPDKSVRIPFLKSYHVFNVDQCDGLPEKLLAGERSRVV